MPLVIKKGEGAYWWPVEVKRPLDGGRFETEKFDAQFIHIPQSELDAMREEVRMERMTDADIVGRVLVGWKGVLDEEKQQVPFSETNKGFLLEVPGMRVCILRAFFESLSGGGARKN